MSRPRRSEPRSLTSSIARSGSAISGALHFSPDCSSASLLTWLRSLGTASTGSINSKQAELFYWITILFSRTLGTALGDWMADSTGLGYAGGALVVAAGLAATVAAHFRTNVSRTVLFWIAFVLTRPLGVTVGDFLDKPLDHGGLALSRYTASASLAAVMVLLILVLPQRSGTSGVS